MRSDYKISRARDGRLIVRQATPGGVPRRLISLTLAALVCGVALLMLPSAGDLVTSLVAKIPTIFSDDGQTSASTQRQTITLKLPLEQHGDSVPRVENLEAVDAFVGQPVAAESDALATEVQTAATAVQPPTADVATQTRETNVEGDSVEPALQAASTVNDEPPPTVVEVKRGDSLYTIFNALGLSQAEMLEVAKGEGKQLTRIHPGQSLEFHVAANGTLEALLYRIDEVSSVHFRKTETGFVSEQIEDPLEVQPTTTQGQIESSLFLSGQSAGLSDYTIMSLVEIFGWDVDFALDIRRGDKFSVIYEELFKDGEKVRDGKILAAEFVNQGRRIRAVRYTDPQGKSNYFAPDGASMRKAFLRTPVDFSRISSHFNLKRKHPVLNTIRAHKGVDYAARRGTPVKATGDGKIAHLGRKGGYGKTIIIRHGATYTTLYGHLNGYAKGMANGKSVRQGQIIGYVGSTGLATGPHLHYEFRVRGEHRNPLKVELPKAAPIADQYKQDFVHSTRSLVSQLDYLSGTQIASGQLASQ